LVIVHDVAKVVPSAVVGLAHAHGVVREVDIAVVAYSILVYVSAGLIRVLWPCRCDGGVIMRRGGGDRTENCGRKC
jgi:hypothetical protein